MYSNIFTSLLAFNNVYLNVFASYTFKNVKLYRKRFYAVIAVTDEVVWFDWNLLTYLRPDRAFPSLRPVLGYFCRFPTTLQLDWNLHIYTKMFWHILILVSNCSLSSGTKQPSSSTQRFTTSLSIVRQSAVLSPCVRQTVLDNQQLIDGFVTHGPRLGLSNFKEMLDLFLICNGSRFVYMTHSLIITY